MVSKMGLAFALPWCGFLYDSQAGQVQETRSQGLLTGIPIFDPTPTCGRRASRVIVRYGLSSATFCETLASRKTTMPDRLSDVKAEVLLDQLNRRTRLLGIVQNTAPRQWSFWSLSAKLLIGAVLGVLTYVLVREETLSSFILMLVVCTIVGIVEGVATLNKRVDALVKLLREEGVLQSTPPVAKLLDEQ
ncbi:MAG: hypothetical protein NTZ17_07460 [Phycisphaerae bacterium]|nr:hypothetical protein [Phycisphaerae bacterium]